MVTCQSANQLKTPAKVSWAFKMVSQFGSLGYTIMGKTADLTVVQKTIIDTLHKEGKPQTFIAKEAGCSQSAASKHVNRKLSGRKKCGRKRCTTNQKNRSLMRIVKQNRFKNVGELHKEWTETGIKASRATTHIRVKELGYSCHQRPLTWAKEKNWTVAQWSKVLFSDESKFCISFGNQGPRVWRKGGEAHSPSCLKSSVKFPQSVMIWAAIITIKRTKDLNYFSLCALNLFNTQVSQFELNYWNKWTFLRHSNLLRCTCITNEIVSLNSTDRQSLVLVFKGWIKVIQGSMEWDPRVRESDSPLLSARLPLDNSLHRLCWEFFSFVSITIFLLFSWNLQIRRRLWPQQRGCLAFLKNSINHSI